MAISHVTTAADIRNLPTRRGGDVLVQTGGRHISWSAVFSGVFCGMAIQLLCTALGGAIGMTTLNNAGTSAAQGVGIGGAVWLGVSMLISAYLGGWITARFSANPDRLDCALHGLASWAVTWLLGSVLVLVGAGALIGGLGKLVGGAAQAAPGIVNATGAGGAVKNTLQNAGQRFQGAVQNPANQAQARNTAQNVTDKATAGAAIGGWSLFGMMLLAALASIGGGITAPQRTYTPRMKA